MIGMKLSASLLFVACLSLVTIVQTSEIQKPWFEEEPVDSLNVITKSAIIRCKIVNALNGWWECSEDERFIEKKNTPNIYVDPRTGVRHIELQLEVKRKSTSSSSSEGHLSTSLGKTHNFECWCNAYGGHQTVSSRRASLQFSNSWTEESILPKPVNGGWSSWSSWSTCSHECQHVRKRSCVNPSPKYGGVHCHGADFHIRNCSGGLCRKLDLYQQKRQEDSSPRTGLYLVSSVSAIFFVLLVVIVVILRRRRLKHHDPAFVHEAVHDDRHAIHLLLQQQQQHLQPEQQSQPDLIRNGGAKKQLISRMSNFNANVLEHFFIRNEHLMSNTNLTSDHIQAGSNQAVNYEPDYAEPVISKHANFTPEKRPPLPKSSPPTHNIIQMF